MLQLCRGCDELCCLVIGTPAEMSALISAVTYVLIVTGKSVKEMRGKKQSCVSGELLCVKRMSKETWCHQVEQEIKAHL
jgi:hypothetical protein